MLLKINITVSAWVNGATTLCFQFILEQPVFVFIALVVALHPAFTLFKHASCCLKPVCRQIDPFAHTIINVLNVEDVSGRS